MDSEIRCMHRYQGHVSAALVLGGVDFSGPHLFTVCPTMQLVLWQGDEGLKPVSMGHLKVLMRLMHYEAFGQYVTTQI